MAQREKPRKDGALVRIMKAPMRALSRALDNYLSDTTFPGHGVGGYPSGGAAGLPRSFSKGTRRSSDEDYRYLVRNVSYNAMGTPKRRENRPTVQRSRSVAICRIDEDKPCEFGSVGPASLVYPRSRSYKVWYGSPK